MEDNNVTFVQDAFKTLKDRGIVHTQKDFASLLNVDKTQISKALSGDERNITKNLVKKIQQVLEEVEQQTPDLFTPDKESILVLPTGARAGTLADFADSLEAYECERITSPIKGADYAMQVTGDSMSPEYPSGSQIIIKKIHEEQFVEWGKVFCLDTINGAVIKQVFPTDNPEIIECRSLNPAYPPFQIDTRHIRGWYRVLMVMALK